MVVRMSLIGCGSCPVEEALKQCGPSVPPPYTIQRVEEIAPGATLAWVRYHAATNYGGRKLMLYAATRDEVMNADLLDPHFGVTKLSPVARFVPTDFGVRLAISCAREVSEMRKWA